MPLPSPFAPFALTPTARPGCPCCPGPGRPRPPWRYTRPRPWRPLTEAEWTALVPYLGDHFWRAGRRGRAGRPLSCDPRARFEAMLRAAVTGTPWHRLEDGRGGKGTTVGRHFTRLAAAGLWSRLLEAVADPLAPPVLRRMEYWICRLARRAMRTLDMAGQDLAKRVGRLSALPMRTPFLPDRHLSEAAHHLAGKAVRMVEAALDAAPPGQPFDAARLPPPGWLNDIGRLLAMAGGRRVWSRRFAPP